ncbi:hypothetical protein E5288_WYG011549 [Bos mutus]|uniref:Uncharacterized protein n=1 Tax=Bos mutus TaxID=72004 RepID=A0A6B0RQU4_9CETA|nr:hypothetical protein [Bos mutus]
MGEYIGTEDDQEYKSKRDTSDRSGSVTGVPVARGSQMESKLPPQDIRHVMLCVCTFGAALAGLQRLMLLIYVISSECQLAELPRMRMTNRQPLTVLRRSANRKFFKHYLSPLSLHAAFQTTQLHRQRVLNAWHATVYRNPQVQRGLFCEERGVGQNFDLCNLQGYFPASKTGRSKLLREFMKWRGACAVHSWMFGYGLEVQVLPCPLGPDDRDSSFLCLQDICRKMLVLQRSQRSQRGGLAVALYRAGNFFEDASLAPIMRVNDLALKSSRPFPDIRWNETFERLPSPCPRRDVIYQPNELDTLYGKEEGCCMQVRSGLLAFAKLLNDMSADSATVDICKISGLTMRVMSVKGAESIFCFNNMHYPQVCDEFSKELSTYVEAGPLVTLVCIQRWSLSVIPPSNVFEL